MKTKTICLFMLVTSIACNNGSLFETDPSASAALGNLHLTAVHHLTEGNNKGYTVTLETALLSWRSLVLISAGEDPECEAGQDQTLQLNITEDLLTDSTELELGTFSIPMISYCQYEIHFSAIQLSGRWSKEGVEGTFDLQPTEPAMVTNVFVSSHEGASHPFHFHEGETEAAKSFATDSDLLLQDLDFANMTDAALEAQVIENVGIAIDQKLE